MKYDPAIYWAAAYAVGQAIHVGPHRYFRWRAEVDAWWFRLCGHTKCSVGRFS